MNNRITANDGERRSFAIYTLGCKVNQEEGVALANAFKEHGYLERSFEQLADVYIINTCTVTHLADRKSRQFIRRAIRLNPAAVVVATGCYAQVSAKEIAAISGVDLIIGANDRHRLLPLVEAALADKGCGASVPQLLVTPSAEAQTYQELGNLNSDTARERAYIKIEDGCSQFCSYCIIPYARGPVRSRPLADILTEAEGLVAAGYKELVLTGIHTGAYGTDLPSGELNLARLAAQLADLPGLARLRLGSIEPQEVTEELLLAVQAHENICHHFHIPLQACSDRTLRAMNRHYTVAYYEELLARIHELFPTAAVTTDLIVGFPGEDEAEFAAASSRLAALGLADIHVFPYSPRRGTPAASFPEQVSPAEKNRRAAVVAELKHELKQSFWQGQLGVTQELLVERRQARGEHELWVGHSRNYLPLAVPVEAAPSWERGGLYRVRPVAVNTEYLTCEVVLN